MKEKSWEEAYTYVADKLLSIKETYGGDAIAGISTGQLPFEEMALFSHVMRNFLRGHVDGNTRLCMATSVVAHKQSFGFDAPPYTLNDFELSDTIFLIGQTLLLRIRLFGIVFAKTPIKNSSLLIQENLKRLKMQTITMA